MATIYSALETLLTTTMAVFPGVGGVRFWTFHVPNYRTLIITFQNLHWEVKDIVKLMLSEYFCRQCYIAVDPSEPYLTQIIEFIGSDNLIFGSGYPHMDRLDRCSEKCCRV
ncbi:hypothetical protein [Okeania sp. SIO2B9]|uniref:hypothetical protein n=1 Tax=Okeania sp. SIO2B9 TaxID=2607782 RepID=UPI00142923BD|nr:hypothetical protein [Okeania sp. SIO2B9]NES89755.1 hypothetical protein [Okeania sp. SIO2B9]